MISESQTFDSLLVGLDIIKNNPGFPQSTQGFLLNVSQSLRRGIITEEQKDFLIGLLLK